MKPEEGHRIGFVGVALSAMVLVTLSAIGQDATTPNPPRENPSAVPECLVGLGDTLYFVADDGLHGRELWAWTRERGAYLVADIVPGAGSSKPDKLTPLGGVLYFRAETPEHGRELWFWDPERGEAVLVGDIAPGPESSIPEIFDITKGLLYFSAENAATGRELWVTRAASADAHLVDDIGPGPADGVGKQAIVAADGKLCFWGVGSLWGSDGTKGGTAKLWTGPDNRILGALGRINERVLFVAGGTARNEPWYTDGTEEGAALLKEINPHDASGITAFHTWNAALYFSANDGSHGMELWKTDGTEGGTLLVKDIHPGAGWGDPHCFASTETALFFLADDGVHGIELWRSGGAEENTVMVTDLYAGAEGSMPWRLTPMGNRLFFCANTPDFGEEVCVTDGTAQGTGVFLDIVPGPASSGPHQLTVLEDLLLFTCDNGIHGEELWLSDGTPEGTRLAADINIPRQNPSSDPRELTALGDVLLFVAQDREHGRELWWSNGTSEGTCLLCDLEPGMADGAPRDLVALGDEVLFTAQTESAGRELWVSDGTQAGTHLLLDIREGTKGSFPEKLYAAEGCVYFTADDGVHGREAWCSDGTREGTVLLADQRAGPGSTSVTYFFSWAGQVYFWVRTDDAPPLLCRVGWDGAGETALSVASVQEETVGLEMWTGPRSQMTSEAEVSGFREEERLLIPLLFPCTGRGDCPETVELGSMHFFACRTDQHGTELWATERSPGSTRLFVDAFPGRASSSPRNLLVNEDRLFFVAEHPTEGRVLWCSDGTVDGTQVVRPPGNYPVAPLEFVQLGPSCVLSAPPSIDHLATRENVELHFLTNWAGIVRKPDKPGVEIRPGGEGSWPRALTVAGGRFFFTADDGIHGRELWVSDGHAAGTHLVRDILSPGDLSPMHR